MTDKKMLKKSAPKPASALRFRIDQEGLLRARVSASAGEFHCTPDLVHLLCLLQRNVSVAQLATVLRRDFQSMTAELPKHDEIQTLLADMTDAQCLIDEAAQGRTTAQGISDGFGDPWIQWAMLTDKKRCQSYQKAIEQTVTQRSNVLDVGAGTGLLSLFALNAGARRVDAIEETSSAKILLKLKQSLAARDKDRLVIHNCHSADARIPEDITHIISELFGNDPLQEGVIHTLRDIFSRVHQSKIKVIPLSFDVLIQLIDIKKGPLKERIARLSPSEQNNRAEPWAAVSKIRSLMSFDGVSLSHPIRSDDYEELGALTPAFTIPLSPPPAESARRPQGQHNFSISKKTSAPALMICFRAHLTEKISISNIPGQADHCEHWSPLLIPLTEAVKGQDALKILVGVNEDWEKLTATVKNAAGQTIGSRT